MLDKPLAPYRRFPCVTPSWDNSPRRGRIDNSLILANSTPDAYRRWVEGTLEKAIPALGDEPILFINAWNEWAEGNHLEPDLRFGHGYLQATRRALRPWKR
jgi:hypothetical protein